MDTNTDIDTTFPELWKTDPQTARRSTTFLIEFGEVNRPVRVANMNPEQQLAYSWATARGWFTFNGDTIVPGPLSCDDREFNDFCEATHDDNPHVLRAAEIHYGTPAGRDTDAETILDAARFTYAVYFDDPFDIHETGRRVSWAAVRHAVKQGWVDAESYEDDFTFGPVELFDRPMEA